jgi:hypothetical protein
MASISSAWLYPGNGEQTTGRAVGSDAGVDVNICVEVARGARLGSGGATAEIGVGDVMTESGAAGSGGETLQAAHPRAASATAAHRANPNEINLRLPISPF